MRQELLELVHKDGRQVIPSWGVFAYLHLLHQWRRHSYRFPLRFGQHSYCLGLRHYSNFL